MLTVFIATRNGERTLPDVLEAFTRLKAPTSGWKLVIVDNASTDRTREIVHSFLDRLPLTYVYEGRLGKTFALNTALAHLEGDLAVFTDDDIFPHPDWLIALQTAADANSSYSMFGGAIVPRWEVPPPPWVTWVPSGYNPLLLPAGPSRYAQGDLSMAFAVTDPRLREGPIEAHKLFGPNLAIRAAVFKSGTLFNTAIGPRGNSYAMGSETELLMRLQRQGLRAWHVPSAIVEHFIREFQLSKSWILKRTIRYGRGIYHLSKDADQARLPDWLVIPRHPYIRLLKTGVQLVITWLKGNKQEVFAARWRFHYFLGIVVELRACRRRPCVSPHLSMIKKSTVQSPVVLIIGPPWVLSGTGKVIQNQIEYYRHRGYLTVFVAVAVDPHHVRGAQEWHIFEQGVHQLGAEYVSIAALEPFRWSEHYARKFSSLVRHRGRGTALNWIVDMARTAQLPDEFARFLRELTVAVIHVNHVYTLGFAQRLRRQWVRDGRPVPMIVESHDIQSRILQERGALNPWTHHPDDLQRSLQAEKALLRQADVIVHCSVDDFKFFQTEIPDKPHVLALPVIDEALISAVSGAPPPLSKAIDLLFVGANHIGNLAALQWFFERVWPRIADRRFSLKIVGSVADLVSRDLPQIYESFRACFVGRVDDLAPYYRAARCVFAPMVSGCGISVKTVEALALGKPFIGTSKAFRGMPVEQVIDAGLRVHDDPEGFAKAIVSALDSEETAGALSRTAYDRIFSQQAAFASRDEAIRLAAGRAQH